MTERQPIPDSELTIVKLRPDGSEAARYPGKVLASPAGWVAAEAHWGHRRTDLGYVVYEPGDRFLEYFALELPFNAFAVSTPEGCFKGWYCNVTLPTRIENGILYWHDLYVDVIVDPAGKVCVLDEDELEASGLAEQDPARYRMILGARDTLLGMIAESVYPFDAPNLYVQPG